MKIEPIILADKFKLIDDYWHPKIIGELNGQHVKIAKIKGEFDWHTHQSEDEMFLVIKGEFYMELRNQRILLKTGESIIIPKGIEHRPVAEEEAHILLFEPVSTINTGSNHASGFTRKDIEAI